MIPRVNNTLELAPVANFARIHSCSPRWIGEAMIGIPERI